MKRTFLDGGCFLLLAALYAAGMLFFLATATILIGQGMSLSTASYLVQWNNMLFDRYILYFAAFWGLLSAGAQVFLWWPLRRAQRRTRCTKCGK